MRGVPGSGRSGRIVGLETEPERAAPAPVSIALAPSCRLHPWCVDAVPGSMWDASARAVPGQALKEVE